MVGSAARARLDGAVPGVGDDELLLVMEGPSETWFGVGFGGERPGGMARAYAIVAEADADGKTGKIRERKLTDKDAGGADLGRSIRVHENAVVGHTRTVILSRPMQGASRST